MQEENVIQDNNEPILDNTEENTVLTPINDDIPNTVLTPINDDIPNTVLTPNSVLKPNNDNISDTTDMDYSIKEEDLEKPLFVR